MALRDCATPMLAFGVQPRSVTYAGTGYATLDGPDPAPRFFLLFAESREEQTLSGPVRLQFDLDHQPGQGESFKLEPGSGRKLLRVDRMTIRGDLEELRHIGRKDILRVFSLNSIEYFLGRI